MDSLNQNEPNNTTSLPSSVWKILTSQNGDKYITFSDQQSQDNYANSDENENESNKTIRVYPMRWYILSVICVANISNAICWINFSPIADLTGQFYSIDFDEVNFLSLVYLISSTPAGFFSFWLIDTFGVRVSLNLGSWINFLGAVIRLFSALDLANGEPFIPQEYKYTVLMTGQSFCSLAQPFILFVATKFATNWFADDQRALANTVALGSNTMGILVGAVLSPVIVNSSVKFVSEMCLLHLISTLIAVIPPLMACFITRSKPPTPPTYSGLRSLQSNESTETDQLLGETKSFSNDFKIYLGQVKNLLKSRDFLILFFCFGLALGVFNCFTTLVEQIICTLGYSDNDSGYFTGAMLVSGLVGSLISGLIIDKTKRFEELAKFCFAMSAVANACLAICLQWNNDQSTVYYLTLVTFCLIGFFGLPLLPICMDMSVECVYPIPEATSTGLLFIAGQIVGIIMIVVYPKAARVIQTDSYIYNSVQSCTSNAPTTNHTITTTASSIYLSVLDYKYPLYSQAILFAIMSIGFTIFFKCAYLRLRSEREKEVERIMRSAANNE